MSAKKLGFGMMRLPLLGKDDSGSIDIELTKKMVDVFMERGFTYFDTAWMYCNYKSEEAVKAAVVDRYPRSSFTLTTKLHSAFVHSFEDRDRIFNEQLRKTGVEYFDYYLLHDVNAHSYEIYKKYDCYEWLKAKKAQGLTRHIAMSFHDGADFLDKVLTEWPEIEFVQLQLNYLDWDSLGVQSRRCYETAVKHGKKVIVMEPVKGGTLAKLPENVETMFRAHSPAASNASWAIRFAASCPEVFMVLSGMSDMQQVLDNTGYMQDFKPLDEDEQSIIKSAVDIINGTIAIPCTGCSYCTDGCPMNIAIPRYFSLYNADKQEPSEKGWSSHEEYYYNLTKNFGKASECIGCGQCEGVCPQHLPIRKLLKDVAEHFERTDH